MKQLLTPKQHARMWRNAAIRKLYAEYLEAGSAKTETYKEIAKMYKNAKGEPLSAAIIRKIVKEKGAKNG